MPVQHEQMQEILLYCAPQMPVQPGKILEFFFIIIVLSRDQSKLAK
jgi:hypothetical protein